MTAHKLAKVLLEGPDLPVIINGWGSDAGNTYEAKPGDVNVFSFRGSLDNKDTLKDVLGYELPRAAVCLIQDEP